jgi:starch synthase
LNCVYASSEVAGFAKSGGLADVSAALPRALAHRGHTCAVFMPFYHCVRQGGHTLEPAGAALQIPIGDRTVAGSLWRSTLPGSDVPVYLIEQADFFERDDHTQGSDLYQYRRPDGHLADYPDNCARFVFFARAVLESLRCLNLWPDVLHTNDWHTGLIPVYLKEVYCRHPVAEVREHYRRIRTLLTIHNVAYQGNFPAHDMPVTGLPWSLFNYRQLEFYGYLSFLKAGIVFSDLITTVSPTYAREIQTPYFGCGLQGVLYEWREDLYGILNGVDYSIWDAAVDRYLPMDYTSTTVQRGKAAGKHFLQEKLGLPIRPRTPLVGMISRLTSQKGTDLVLDAAVDLLRNDVQLVVLGEGDVSYQSRLVALRDKYPAQVAVGFDFDEALAHQIEAGADLFLMPSLYEPCGLNQLYSLRYGTVPIVRRTGGLADTVVDTTPETLQNGTATGFVFVPPSPAALLEAVRRALTCYHNQPGDWSRLLHTGMAQDWSWDKSAEAYEGLYQKVARGKQS